MVCRNCSVLVVLCVASSALAQVVSDVKAQVSVQSDNTATVGPRIVVLLGSGPQRATSGTTGRSTISGTVTKAIARASTNNGSASILQKGEGSTTALTQNPAYFGVSRVHPSDLEASVAATDWIITGPPGPTSVRTRIRWGWNSIADFHQPGCQPPQNCVNCAHWKAEGAIQVVAPGVGYTDDVEAIWDGSTLTGGLAHAQMMTEYLDLPLRTRIEVTVRVRLYPAGSGVIINCLRHPISGFTFLLEPLSQWRAICGMTGCARRHDHGATAHLG